MKFRVIAAPLLFGCLSPTASAELANEAGFSGQLSLHVGAKRETSQFITDENETQTSLSASAPSSTQIVPFPMWDLNYTFNGLNNQVYFKSDLEGMASGFYTELGVRHGFSDGTAVSLGYIPGLIARETWQDPFQTGSKRQVTDENISGIRLSADNLFGSAFSGELAYGNRKIEDETSGLHGYSTQQQHQLQRSGYLTYLSLTHQLTITETSYLESEVHWLNNDADGDAMNSQRVGLELEYQQRFGSHLVLLGANYFKHDYKDTHPVFSFTRDDDQVGASLGYVYLAPFGLTQWSTIVRAGWDKSDSNIDFYDSEELLTTVGVMYRF